MICFKHPEPQDLRVKPNFKLEAIMIRVLIADDSDAVRQSLHPGCSGASEVQFLELVKQVHDPCIFDALDEQMAFQPRKAAADLTGSWS